jgi:hypothetical protein
MAKKAKCDSVRVAHEKKEVKVNPFDLRFNRIKQKVVNQKLHKCDYGANPYKSKAHALQIRTDTLLNEYRNKNHEGKIVQNNEKKKSRKDQDDGEKKKGGDQTMSVEPDAKKRSHEERMRDLYNAKIESRVDKERMDVLQNKLDDQWSGLRLVLEAAKAPSNDLDLKDGNDSYDLILNDLMFNKGERCVQGDLLKKTTAVDASNKPKVTFADRTTTAVVCDPTEPIPMGLSNITVFGQRLAILQSASSYPEVKETLESLLSFKRWLPQMYRQLQGALVELDSSRSLLSNSATLLAASIVPSLRQSVHFKLAELLRSATNDSISSVLSTLQYTRLSVRLAEKRYLPETICAINNLLVLSLPKGDHDRLYLPTHRFQKIACRSFLTLPVDRIDLAEQITLSLQAIVSNPSIDFTENELKVAVFFELTKLIRQLFEQLNSSSAFEGIFHFTRRLLRLVKELRPSYGTVIDQLLSVGVEQQPSVEPVHVADDRPLMLDLLEPNFDFDDGDDQRETDVEKVQVKIRRRNNELKRKLKREMKSAQREIKKDSAFLQTIKLTETIERDRVRKEKVKKLIQEINDERSMFKK